MFSKGSQFFYIFFVVIIFLRQTFHSNCVKKEKKNFKKNLFSLCEIASFCSNDELTKIFYGFIQINYEISRLFLNKTKSKGRFFWQFWLYQLRKNSEI